MKVNQIIYQICNICLFQRQNNMNTAFSIFLANFNSLFENSSFVERWLFLLTILSIYLLTQMKVSIWIAIVIIFQLFNLTDTHVLRPLVKSQNYLLFNMPGPGLIKQQQDRGKNEQGAQSNKKIERIQRCLIYESLNQKIGSTELFEGYAICPDIIVRIVKRIQVDKVKQNKFISKMKDLINKQVKKEQKMNSTIEIQQIKTKEEKQLISQQVKNKRLKQINSLEQPSIKLLPRLKMIVTKQMEHREQSPKRILETCTNGSCIPQFCGDGVVNQNGAEQCDDGNNVEKDRCTNCIKDYCGDGIINQNGTEQCDDGNYVNGDGCTKCIKDYCGDGVVNQNGAEQCDDGNDISTDGCTNCILDCGNGIIQSAEQCDDGNRVSGDGCDQYCYNQKKRVLIAVFGTIGGVAVIAVVLGIIFGKFGGSIAAGQSANSLQVGGMNNFDVLAEAEAKKYII